MNVHLPPRGFIPFVNKDKHVEIVDCTRNLCDIFKVILEKFSHYSGATSICFRNFPVNGYCFILISKSNVLDFLLFLALTFHLYENYSILSFLLQ